MPLSNLPARCTASTFTPQRANAFVCRLSDGRALAAVCRDPDMPSRVTIQNWMAKDPAFAAQVAAVRDRSGARANTGGHQQTRYTPELARGICAALAEGFTLKEVCAHPDVPVGPLCVQSWVRKRPDFAALYRQATAPRQTDHGLRIGRGRRGGFTRARAEAVIARLLDGRALSDIARDPDMPTRSVIRHWGRRHIRFFFELHEARRFQLHLAADDLIEAVDAGRPAGNRRHMLAALFANGYAPLTGPAEGADLPPPKPVEPAPRRRGAQLSRHLKQRAKEPFPLEGGRAGMGVRPSRRQVRARGAPLARSTKTRALP